MAGESGTSPLVAAAVGVVVGITVVVVGIWAGFVAAGDEAPIRVRNGSIEMELLYAGKQWKEDGDKKHWKMTGSRNSDDYELFIAPTNTADCSGGLNPKGKTIRFEYSDTTYVELKAQNKKTKVTSNKDLTKSADGATLSYPAADGHISLIRVDATDVCKFAAKDTKLGVVLVDQ
jgi:hypothetical protein